MLRTRRTFVKGFIACALCLIMLGQTITVFAEPTIDFNGGRYTREEFMQAYGDINTHFYLGDVRVGIEQIFDMFSMTLLDQYRLTEEEVAEWIYAYETNGGISGVELQLLYYTNIERARVGVPPLQLCPILSMAARFKAEEMVQFRYFAHESPVYGCAFNISSELFGIDDMRSENLARRITRPNTAYDLIQSWRSSPGHWANMLDPDHRYLGVGIIENVMGMGINYDGTPIPDRYASLGVQKFR